MKMRELEKLSGINRKMIQHYINNGMLPEPERPKRNVAIYNEQHVNALRSIRQLQSEGRLSIKEIKQLLAGNPGRHPANTAVYPHIDELFAAHSGVDLELVSLESLLPNFPHAAKDAANLERIGAIKLVNRDKKLYLTHLDAQIVACWGDMREAGFTEEEGFNAEIMSIHVNAAEELANAEVNAFLSHTCPTYSVERKAEMAQAGSKITLNLFSLLRIKATMHALKHML